MLVLTRKYVEAERANPPKGGDAKPWVCSRSAMIARLPKLTVATPLDEEPKGVYFYTWTRLAG